ncbi:MAG: PRC-barrel domain-containing protein [Pseudomonadota bacterium]
MPALMLALSACGEPNQVDEPANEPGVGEYTEEAAADAGEIAEDVGEAVAKSAENTTNAIGEAIQKEIDDINALGMTARNILDVEVRTRKGEVAARVDDLLFTRAGEPALAVLSEGGIFGVGDDLVLVTVQRFIMTEDELGDVSIVMTLTDEELEALGDGISYLPADFSVGGEVDTSLLSARKILDAAIYNPEGEKVADMYDFILGREWNIDSAILSDGGLADIGDRLVRIDWSAISMAADNASFETTPTTPDFDTLPRFEYGQLLER